MEVKRQSHDTHKTVTSGRVSFVNNRKASGIEQSRLWLRTQEMPQDRHGHVTRQSRSCHKTVINAKLSSIEHSQLWLRT